MKNKNKKIENFFYVVSSVFVLIIFALCAKTSVDLSKQFSNQAKAESSNSLWLIDAEGNLKACDSSGSCVDYGRKGTQILAVDYFKNKIWFVQVDGSIQICDSTGNCTNFGDQGRSPNDIVGLNDGGTNEVWLGDADGYLISCNTFGVCTNHGDKGAGINHLVVFDNKIWIGQEDGKLQKCSTDGTCIDYGAQSESTDCPAGSSCVNGVQSMYVFDNKLWLSTLYGKLKSCDSSGNCTDYGDLGYYWNGMTEFNNKLWFLSSDGKLFSSDSMGSTTYYGVKTTGTTNFAITTFDNKLWFSASSRLYSCDANGNCTDRGDKGGIVIEDMVTAGELDTDPLELPDLSVKSITFRSGNNYVNEEGDLSVTVDNLGGRITSNNGLTSFNNNFASLNFVFSNTTPSIEYYEASRVTPSELNPLGYGESITFTWHGKFTTAGTKYLTFTVNYANQIVETNNTNNTKVATVTINSPSSGGGGNTTTPTYTCNDSDNGKNYYVKGYAVSTKDNIKFYDTCTGTGSSTDQLLETICYSTGLTGSDFYTCPNGCKEGACLASSTSQTEKKVVICHVPPGNSENKKTIEVAESAVKALLDQGSYLGACLDDKNKKDKLETVASSTKDTELKAEVGDKDSKIVDSEITAINEKAKILKNNGLEDFLAEIKESRDQVKEQKTKLQYLGKLVSGAGTVAKDAEEAIANFITYGVDDNTKKLGAGERAAVMFSYKEAFGKLPETEGELADAIKIANGRWPSTASSEAEKNAKEEFRRIYKRIAITDNQKDEAAITVMAYGLRQKSENRNLKSEQTALGTFKSLYGYIPSTTDEWNILQAITYSGATRGIDSDKDLLTDEKEKELGTDPQKADSDGDGYIDGIEVETNHNPKGKE